MSNKKLSKVREKISKRTEGAILGKLWRKIIEDRGLAHNLAYLVDEYERESKSNDNVGVKYKPKSSIIDNITAEEMTWRNFVSVLIKILKVKNIRFVISLTHESGEVSNHAVNFKASPSSTSTGTKNKNSKEY